MSTGLIKKDETAVAPIEHETVVAQIVRMAADPNMDVAKLEKLIDMQERVRRSEAESEFNRAFAVMQGEIPTVAERAKGDKWMYAPLEDILEVVRPILQKHGFSLSHRTEWPEKNVVKVIGILSHRLGHSRESEFMSGADASGSKNAIQGLGSTNHYGRRYTTNDLLCIVTRKADDDGATSQPRQIVDPPGFDDWLTDLSAAADTGKAAMTEAWEKAKPEFREHATKHYKGKLAHIRQKVTGGQR
jgi:hypothetical protein